MARRDTYKGGFSHLRFGCIWSVRSEATIVSWFQRGSVAQGTSCSGLHLLSDSLPGVHAKVLKLASLCLNPSQGESKVATALLPEGQDCLRRGTTQLNLLR